MKILHITDSHGTVKTPESRIDLYYLTFLKKLAELRYVIQMYNIDMVIHTGDLFHISRVSNKLMGQVAEIFNAYGVPIYIVPGNHDIDGYTIDTIDQTSLGLLAKTGVFKLLTRDKPIRLNMDSPNGNYSIAISGQEYYENIDTGNMEDFEMQQPDADINVLAIHGYIADTQQHPNIKCTYPKDIITDADIVLSGHYHRSFELEIGDVAYYNPGSMLRDEMNQYNKTHMPQYGILDISLDSIGNIEYNYQFHQFRIAEAADKVFDYNVKSAIKANQLTIDNFKNTITNSIQSIQVPITTPRNTVDVVMKQYIQDNNLSMSISMALGNEISNIYNNAVNQIIDDDVMTTRGFIPSRTPIKITKVRLENFQSHQDTVMEFKDGLNIILGESNSGKTAFFRGVLWATNNTPSGSDFIMTGSDWCRVTIDYDNGTIIERYRTRKDTGHYKVTFYDDTTGQMNTSQYKGFANNIPVEIMNAHQMPKLSLSKNTETHLNVMTQLEKPFLISDSINEKAVAIGRITGTNVIDESIKINNAELTLNKKALKSLTTEEEGIKKEIDLINIVAARKALDYIQKLAVKANKLKQEDSELSKIKPAYQRLTNAIDTHSEAINKFEEILKQKPMLETLEEHVKKLQLLIEMRKSYTKSNQSIIDCNQNILTYEKIIKRKLKCFEIDKILNEMNQISALKSNYNFVRTSLFSTNNKIVSLNQKVLKKEEIEKKETIVANIKKAIYLLNSYQSLTKVIKIQENRVLERSTFINEKNETIKGIDTELKSFVLSQGVCPCCGQAITDSNVENVINNFGG